MDGPARLAAALWVYAHRTEVTLARFEDANIEPGGPRVAVWWALFERSKCLAVLPPDAVVSMSAISGHDGSVSAIPDGWAANVLGGK